MEEEAAKRAAGGDGERKTEEPSGCPGRAAPQLKMDCSFLLAPGLPFLRSRLIKGCFQAEVPELAASFTSAAKTVGVVSGGEVSWSAKIPPEKRLSSALLMIRLRGPPQGTGLLPNSGLAPTLLVNKYKFSVYKTLSCPRILHRYSQSCFDLSLLPH
ncbi:hypothetical protein J6590_063702 [Homalodisca vitripennis]|nr:hypothetical protein J6590_063702 [Homalodisca vitripennis]